MSGRSRGRKSSRAKGRGRGRGRGRARAAPEPPDPPQDPPEGRRPGEDAPAAAAQVQAGAGWGGLGLEGAALPGPEEDPSRVPLDCGLALRAAGERGQAAARLGLGLGRASSLSERLAADSVFVGTAGPVGRLRNGPRVRNLLRGRAGKKAPAGKKGPTAVAGGKPKTRDPAAAGECASAPEEEEPTVEEEEEEEEEEEDAGAGTPAATTTTTTTTTDGGMDTLESVQQKLESMNAQADRAYLRLCRKFGQLRLQHLERRSLLIRSVPGFWARALQNHPQLSSFLTARDREVLGFLNSLEVEELGLARLGYKIKFYFERNPYFQNKVLIKEYGCGPSGQVVSRSTPIQWLPGQALESLSQGSPADNSPSFFGWFENHTSIESDKIVEIINEELWPNPLQYYLLSEGARAEKGKEKGKEGRQGPAKQPVEAPEPGSNKSK